MIKRQTRVQSNPPFTERGQEGTFRIGEGGFTLVELMITMVVFVLTIAAASGIFTGLLTQFKQQSKIAETNTEGIIGLEILRRDIEHAGYGLPWSGLIAYNEAASAPASNFNDSTTTSPPKAIVSGNNVTFFGGGNAIFNGTDYLVIKAVNAAANGTCQKWTNLRQAPFSTTAPGNPRIWNTTSDAFVGTERVIVLSMSTNSMRQLVTNGATFSTTYNNITITPWPPTDQSEVRVVYGVDPGTDLRMPFSRADYYILKFDSTGTDIVPIRCAPNTGVLRKAVVNQSAGTFAGGTLPILDCVADMQVIFRLDTNNDGTIDNTTDVISGLSAQQIREQVREVRVYILAQEGQRDPNYTYPNATVTVGEFGLGRVFNFAEAGITNWQNYRWKLYTLVVKPNNLE